MKYLIIVECTLDKALYEEHILEFDSYSNAEKEAENLLREFIESSPDISELIAEYLGYDVDEMFDSDWEELHRITNESEYYNYKIEPYEDS